jgi:DNA-binding PucR family transcriptional regulator
VRRLLNYEPVGNSELAHLRYTLDGWHLGVIVTGVSPRDALESLKADRQLLPVPQGDETVWAWLGARQQLTDADVKRLCSNDEPAGVSLAVGEPARGIEGWRQTHHQAQQALRVGVLTGRSRTRYADVALLAPWLEDSDRGQALVDLYLSPLDRQGDRGRISLQTLHAYHEASWNVSSAARKLGIDRRTLNYRLGTIEERLGYKLDARKAELAVALRLHALLK